MFQYGETVKYRGRYYTVGVVAKGGAVTLWDDEDNCLVVLPLEVHNIEVM